MHISVTGSVRVAWRSVPSGVPLLGLPSSFAVSLGCTSGVPSLLGVPSSFAVGYRSVILTPYRHRTIRSSLELTRRRNSMGSIRLEGRCEHGLKEDVNMGSIRLEGGCEPTGAGTTPFHRDSLHTGNDDSPLSVYRSGYNAQQPVSPRESAGLEGPDTSSGS